MNRHFLGILAIAILVLSVSIFTYDSVYLNDSPLLSANVIPSEESAVNSESVAPSLSSGDVTSTVDDGQALTIAAVEPAPDTQKTVSEPISSDSSKAISPTTSVSRGVQTTNTYKYPQLSKINGSFGQFHYRDLAGGRIEVDPQWIANNIVTITLPGLNQRVQVNKAAAANFIQAFNYIKNGTATINGKQVPLLSLIKTMDGTFVTRHVNWGGPTTGLSNHSWGTAIDINASNHYVGLRIDANSTTDPNAILWRAAFQPAGFSWGNRYNVGPDSMHFELLK
jgi:hypothetical protein